jgi:uncharacterized protein YndB with AHSA1/START domain
MTRQRTTGTEPTPIEANRQEPGTRSAEGRIAIDASPERVWRALTDAQELMRWFPLDARVEPGPDGSIFMSWKNEFASTMKILIWDPSRHLRTGWSFHEAEAPAQVTDYRIESTGGSTLLRVVTSGFPLDESWDGWVEGTVRGWAFELYSLKHYLERHAGQPRHVAYLRRRVPVARDVAWTRLAADQELGRWLTAGRAFDDRFASQRAAVVDDPADALLRISVEPAAPGAEQPEIVMWLSAWGDHAPRVSDLQTAWQRALERLFPKASRPDGVAGNGRQPFQPFSPGMHGPSRSI